MKRQRPTAENISRRWGVNLDARSLDRMTWAQHVCRLHLNNQVSPSVIFRRALSLYADHLDRLLTSSDAGKLGWESNALNRAARGEKDELPDAALLATPPKPFREILKADAGRGRQALQSFLSTPYEPV
jgi:hypothetical protein